MTDYALIRSAKRRTLCLQISPQGRVRLLVPARTQQSDIDNFLKAKADWIARTLTKLKSAPPVRPFTSGLQIPYLDSTLSLDLTPTTHTARVQRIGNVLQVRAPNAHTGRAVTERWYRQEARAHSVDRIIYFAPRVGRTPTQIRIAGQKTRWGSCSTLGTISLNWRLMLAPSALFDYVIAHELCHLLAPHHGASFWAEMARVMPDYEARRKTLHAIGHNLQL